MTQNERFKHYLKDKKVVCDCDGPRCGTNHFLDCEISLAWDDFIEIERDKE